MQMARVLCVMNWSASSRVALWHAASVAEHTQADLHVLQVIAPAVPHNGAAAPAAATVFTERLAWVALDTAIKAANIHQPVVAAVRLGLPPYEIVRYAAEIDAGLVVLSPHRAMATHPRLGTTVDQVIAHAAGPVLTVPDTVPPSVTRRWRPYKQLLCPVDFSPDALDALSQARYLAEANDGELTVLHVIEPTSSSGDMRDQQATADLRLRMTNAECRLARLATESAPLRRAVRRVVASGRPVDVITKTALAEGTDLIVMGVRGNDTPEAARVGTTTRLLVHTGPCAVLTVPPPESRGLIRQGKTAGEFALPC